jgi:thiamine biosynthesis lipoprotein
VLHQLNGKTMGTTYNVSIVLKGNSQVNLGVIKQAIDGKLSEIDLAMSTYKHNSELSRFNQLSIGHSIQISELTNAVVEEARRLSEFSHGAFDVSIAPLVDLWGFGGGSKDPNHIPSQSQIDSALETVGMNRFKLRSNHLSKEKDVKLDLSAIAKGFAVDQIALLLGKNGITRFLVEVGGEVVTRGSSIRNTSWVLGIESPDKAGRSVYTRVFLDDSALATSGDYRNYFERNGVKYSHTIDPRTGRPVAHKLASVSVIADDCMSADGLATALMVLGEDEGFKFAQEHDISALFIYRQEERFLTKHTSKFEQYLK